MRITPPDRSSQEQAEQAQGQEGQGTQATPAVAADARRRAHALRFQLQQNDSEQEPNNSDEQEPKCGGIPIRRLRDLLVGNVRMVVLPQLRERYNTWKMRTPTSRSCSACSTAPK